ncbi:MAG: NCS2 family permease [Zhaonellaceae bacterium]|jgi:AGZA family xanthine/uracil permease-like MFS transporter|nr:NCS2 family permease [Clostridia bacterium]
MLEKFFGFKENGTTLKTEIIAGLTTFVTMAYIIIVNPLTLATPETGMDFGAVMMATCLSAAFTTLLMGLYANYPFALAPGMGLNAFFSYTLVMHMGVSWETALGVVFISGLIAMLVAVSRIRETVIKAIPMHLKTAIGAGIGLFIAFIGLQNAGIIVDNPATLLGFGKITDPHVLLAIFGLIVTGILLVKKVTGSIILGILITTVVGLFVPAGDGTMITNFQPGALGIFDLPPSIAPTLFKLDILGALKFSLFAAIFSLFFVDMFDTIGTLVGVASKTNLMDEKGNLKRGNKALYVDFIGTMMGAFLGTSNVTTYVESASGVNAGGRTGMTAVVVGILFLLSTFLSPVVLAIPGVATAPALILVGVMMATGLKNIDWDDMLTAIPCFLTVIMMPLSYSIATGLAVGFVTYVLLSFLTGRGKDVHWVMYILSLLFVLYFIVQATV